jgi:hypothetical protein
LVKTKLPPKVKKRLNKINRIFIGSVDDSIFRKDYRAAVLLNQVLMEFYIDEILEIHYKSKVFNDLRFEKKIEILKEFKILSLILCENLIIFYGIRNIFAHEIIFDEKK